MPMEEVLRVRVPTPMIEEVRAEAETLGGSVSMWVRLALIEALRRAGRWPIKPQHEEAVTA